jgi:type 1 glutamine amidotransferase
VNPVEPASLLVFTKTAGFRHDSIDTGVALFEYFADEEGYSLTHTEDAAFFSESNLAAIDAIVFLNTTGDILADAEQAAFEAWFRAGGAFVGIHAAADTEYDWPFYSSMIGAQFDSHPAIQKATVQAELSDHPATAGIAFPWIRTDEWYNYLLNPRDSVDVLLVVDEASYSGGTMGADHPIAWAREADGGRAFYTGLGHTIDSYYEEDFQNHVLGGLKWALGVTP